MKDIKTETKEEKLKVQHFQVVTLTLKILNSIKIDPFVKKVMTARLLYPVTTGRERTHMSIALELGANVDEVIEAEAYGVQVIEEMMQKCSNQDFVNKFNADAEAKRIINNELNG